MKRASSKFLNEGDRRREKLEKAKIYLLFIPSLCRGNAFHTLEAVLRAGVDVVQVREKEATSKELLSLSEEVVRLVRGRALVIVNDRADIAALAHADGVHLGQDDLPVGEARKIVGSNQLIGLSTHSLTQLETGQNSGADYLGFGPIFPTSTKGYSQGVGDEDLVKFQKRRKLPVFLLGGITPENLVALRKPERIAVASAVLSDPKPAQVVKNFRQLLS